MRVHVKISRGEHSNSEHVLWLSFFYNHCSIPGFQGRKETIQAGTNNKKVY